MIAIKTILILPTGVSSSRNSIAVKVHSCYSLSIMKLVTHPVLFFIATLFSLWTASYFVPGFVISKNPQNFLMIGLIFTLINLFIRPVLKLILSPIIIFTLGLGIIVVNAVVLYLLDYFSQNVSIIDIPSLVYATLIIGIINLISHFLIKKIF